MNETTSKTYSHNRDWFLNMEFRQFVYAQKGAINRVRLEETTKKGQLEFETIHLLEAKSSVSV